MDDNHTLKKGECFDLTKRVVGYVELVQLEKQRELGGIYVESSQRKCFAPFNLFWPPTSYNVSQTVDFTCKCIVNSRDSQGSAQRGSVVICANFRLEKKYSYAWDTRSFVQFTPRLSVTSCIRDLWFPDRGRSGRYALKSKTPPDSRCPLLNWPMSIRPDWIFDLFEVPPPSLGSSHTP